MIEYVSGRLEELTPTMAVVDCNGVGYGLNISLGTYSAVQGKRDVKLFVYEVIREDAYTLWGFATRSERELFLQLTSVSGIGAAMARMILSAFSPGELVDVISTGNDRALKSVKGIGPKAAQRVIVDLRDKILALDISPAAASSTAATNINTEVQQEAVAALTMLGFSPAPSAKVVGKLLTEEPDMAVEQLIKKALKML
ncbi:MAG: Holliday junction branch migration protein RuvA [Bacteroidaceae bacterium]|nr:Holliday junction branch migration protein RuvA [Bacteroidaceae bacterium]